MRKLPINFFGLLIGAAGGYLYWFITGSVVQELTDTASHWYAAVLYGSMIGLFLADIFSQGLTSSEEK